MAEIGDLNANAANNTARFPEGQSAPTLNDGARELEAIVARHHKDTNFSQTTAGTSAAYTLASNRTITALEGGLEFKCIAHVACLGGATTLQLNALSAKPLVRWDGSTLVVGDIVQHQPLHVVYVSGTDKFHIVGLNG